MKFLMGLVSAFLCLVGCRQKTEFDYENVERTSGELKAVGMKAPPGWAWVRYMDDKGKTLGEAWEFTPPLKRYAKNGRSELPKYLDQLLKSSSDFSTVTLFDLDEQSGFSIHKKDGILSLDCIFQVNDPDDREKTARAWGRELGLPVISDYKSDQEDRVLDWRLPSNRDKVLAIVERFLEDVLNQKEEAGLLISFDDSAGSPDAPDGTSTFMFTYPIPDPGAPPPTGVQVKGP